MALIKQTETKEGFVASYWRINPRVTIDLVTKKIHFTVQCFADRDARIANKQPVDSKSFSTTLEVIGEDIRQALYLVLPTLKDRVFGINGEEEVAFFADAQSDE